MNAVLNLRSSTRPVLWMAAKRSGTALCVFVFLAVEGLVLATPRSPSENIASNSANQADCLVATDKTALLHYQRGLESFNSNRYGPSVHDFSQAIAAAPNFTCAIVRRGIAFAMLGKTQNALFDFNEFVRIQPNSAEAYNARGFHFFQQGLYGRAIRDFDKSIKLNPTSDAFGNRGGAYFNMRDYRRAKNDFSRELQLDPANAQAWVNRADAYGHLQMHDNAIADLTKAIELNPTLANAFSSRCWEGSFLRDGLRDALADCNEALRLDSGHANARNNRGVVFLKMERYQDALRDFDFCVNTGDRRAGTLLGRGVARLRIGLVKLGQEDIALARKLDRGVQRRFRRYGLLP